MVGICRDITEQKADQAALQRIADGWLEWAAAPDGWLLMPHGEILARP
jgi:hypothetical protein